MPQANSNNTLPARVRKLVALVSEHPDGIQTSALLETARTRFPGQDPQVLTALLEQALTAGALTRTDEVVRVHAPEPSTDSPTANAGLRGLRIVVLDLESAVRTIDTEPFTDKRIFQVGAVRIGTDTAWVDRDQQFKRYLGVVTK